MKTLTERLVEYMSYKGLNYNQVTQQAGLSIGLLGKAVRTNKGLHSDSIEKIISTYRDLNPQWLLTGIGEMIINDREKKEIPKEISFSKLSEDDIEFEKIVVKMLFHSYKDKNKTSFDSDSFEKLSLKFKIISVALDRLQHLMEAESLVRTKEILGEQMKGLKNIVLTSENLDFLNVYQSIYNEFVEYDKETFDLLLIAYDKISFINELTKKLMEGKELE